MTPTMSNTTQDTTHKVNDPVDLVRQTSLGGEPAQRALRCAPCQHNRENSEKGRALEAAL